MQTIAILGTGGWGTALAVHLARTGHDVHLWGRDASLVARMRQTRENDVYLPGIALPPCVTPCAALDEAIAGASMLVVAIPSHGLRATLAQAVPYLPGSIPIVSTVKGLEQDTHLRMSEVIAQEMRRGGVRLGAGRADASGAGGSRVGVGSGAGISTQTSDAANTACPHPIVVLSGPSFAAEFARGLPTLVVVASTDRPAAHQVQHEFRSRGFRLYLAHDVVGVELGGALKNIIAIAAGVVESLGLGHNAMAALITRGLAEMSRLATAMGGSAETLAGLSGLGDLVLTCTGQLSRNRHVGIELGRGRALPEILASMKMVAEGVRTTRVALELGAQHGIELPITAQMAEVLEGRKSPRDAVEDLMLRPPRAEADAQAQPPGEN
jgi:glycerol-3-phosphate dehydrogenase (NAD(P)+)